MSSTLSLRRVTYTIDIFNHISDKIVLSLLLNKQQTLAMLANFAPANDPALLHGDHPLQAVFFGASAKPAPIPVRRTVRRPSVKRG